MDTSNENNQSSSSLPERWAGMITIEAWEREEKMTEEFLDKLTEELKQKNKAIEIAREYLEDADHCEEYTDAWIFYKKGFRDFDDSPVVVMKEDFRVIPMIRYTDIEGSNELVREFDLRRKE